jgi:hypothetical protein
MKTTEPIHETCNSAESRHTVLAWCSRIAWCSAITSETQYAAGIDVLNSIRDNGGRAPLQENNSCGTGTN